jgi:toxin CcdB
MSQFEVFTNTNPDSKTIYPYIIDIQSPLLETLETRLVIPLILKSKFGEKFIKNLTPGIVIKNQEYLVMTPQLAAIHKKHLGKLVENCTSHRNEIVSSIDFLITGF